MNRLFYTLLFCFAMTLALQAQTNSQPNALVGKKLWNDYQSLYGGSFSDFDQYGSGFELGYLRNMNPRFNFGIPVQFFVIDLPEELDNVTTVGIDAVGQFNIIPSTTSNRIIPYLTAGVGGVLEDWDDLSFQIPVGIGSNFRFGKYAFVNAQASYRKSLAEDRDNFQYGIGLGFFIGGNVEEEKIEDVVKDTDNDGIEDVEDKCPKVPGVIAFGGCPDTDADGIQDSEDDCPEEAGPKATQGCPDSDSDGFANLVDECPLVAGTLKGCPDDDNDGIANNQDRCPYQAGPASNGGCPDNDRDKDGFKDEEDQCPDVAGPIRGCPDSDKDGFNDKEDACPNEAAPRSKNGCPIIEKVDQDILTQAINEIHFEFGSATLKPISLPSLDKVKAIMDKYPNRRLALHGHTDNIGSASVNQKLSVRRADACRKYLVSKGVSPDRISVEGFGETQPISDNDTESGRALNRRVEFIIME